ncbi:MAG: hypothetical protein U5L96_10815 [Owenweeksia sp.]|nr:hypothetical protein [Owenweeksia sp.]
MKTLLSGMLLLVVLQLAAKPANRLDRDKLHHKILTQNNDPEVVATLSDRDAIPMAMRNELMYCYVADNHKVYQLKGGVSNAHWVELDIASTLKIQGPAGSLPYIDATGLLATDLRYLGKSKYDFSGANSLGQGQYLNVNGVGNTINDKSHNILNSFNSYSNGSYVVILGERDTVMGNHSTALGSQISFRPITSLPAAWD